MIKKAVAYTTLVTLKGNIIFNFQIEYQIFSTRLFRKVFNHHIKPTKNVTWNPYRKNIILENVLVMGNILTANLPSIAPENCAGHFDDIPMLPIGILAYTITNIIGYFLKKITQYSHIKYYLINAQMNVLSPTSLNGKEQVTVTHQSNQGYHYVFSWIVKDNANGILSAMQLTFACYSLSHATLPIWLENTEHIRLNA